MTQTVVSTTHTYRPVDVPVAGGTLRVGVWDPVGAGPTADVPTVVAVHGITASHRAWLGVVSALPGVRVVAPDLRGRGRSNDLPGPYGMAAHADDVAAVVRACGDGPVLALGHSMGAFVATALAHRHPGLVTRLVLVDGGVPLPRPAGLPADATNDEVLHALLGPAVERLAQTFDSHEAYRAFWRAHPAFADVAATILEDYVDYDLVAATAPDGLTAWRPASSYEAVAADSLDLYTGGPVADALTGPAPLRVPTTLLRAPRGLLDTPDALYPHEWLDGWLPRLPHMQVRDVADVNHYTIIMSEPGISAVADAVHTLPRQSPPAGVPGPA